MSRKQPTPAPAGAVKPSPPPPPPPKEGASTTYAAGYGKGYQAGQKLGDRRAEEAHGLAQRAAARAERAEAGLGIGKCSECVHWVRGGLEGSRDAADPAGSSHRAQSASEAEPALRCEASARGVRRLIEIYAPVLGLRGMN